MRVAPCAARSVERGVLDPLERAADIRERRERHGDQQRVAHRHDDELHLGADGRGYQVPGAYTRPPFSST